VEIQPVIESTRGLTRVREIGESSRRIRAMGVGAGLTLEVGEDGLAYARAESELHARALGIIPLDPFLPHD
jgi:citrate lyase beta subunit